MTSTAQTPAQTEPQTAAPKTIETLSPVQRALLENEAIYAAKEYLSYRDISETLEIGTGGHDAMADILAQETAEHMLLSRIDAIRAKAGYPALLEEVGPEEVAANDLTLARMLKGRFA